MEVYLNIIEMGNGIYSAEAASQIYFYKKAKKLSRGEAALIAAVLPNPRRFSPVKPSGFILKRQTFVLRQMTLWGGGVLNYEQKEEIKQSSTKKGKIKSPT